MKKLLLILFTLLSTGYILGSAADILNEDPWRVLQYKFVTKPQKKADSWKNIGLKSIASVGTGATSFSLYGLAHAIIFNHDFKFKYWPNSYNSRATKLSYYPIAPTTFLSTIFAYQLVNQLLIKHYEKEELSDFLRNWDKYKKHIPESLLEKLNIVRQEYLQNKTEVDDQADEIIEVIISQINLHFYGDPKTRNFFDVRYLSANFNTHFVLDLARIIKSMVKAYEVYNGGSSAHSGN